MFSYLDPFPYDINLYGHSALDKLAYLLFFILSRIFHLNRSLIETYIFESIKKQTVYYDGLGWSSVLIRKMVLPWINDNQIIPPNLVKLIKLIWQNIWEIKFKAATPSLLVNLKLLKVSSFQT